MQWQSVSMLVRYTGLFTHTHTRINLPVCCSLLLFIYFGCSYLFVFIVWLLCLPVCYIHSRCKKKWQNGSYMQQIAPDIFHYRKLFGHMRTRKSIWWWSLSLMVNTGLSALLWSVIVYVSLLFVLDDSSYQNHFPLNHIQYVRKAIITLQWSKFFIWFELFQHMFMM